MRPPPGGRPPLAAVLRNRSGIRIELLDNGSLFAIRKGGILVNQALGSPAEGAIGNLYVRRRRRGGVTASPVMGPASSSTFRASRAGAWWDGSADGIEYACSLRLAPAAAIWFWTIRLTNRSARRASLDVVLAQDVGLAEEASVRSSEAYTSQYLDHTILRDDDLGLLLCTRQNLPQDGAHPWLVHGCVDGAVGYLTDGLQLYGTDYKATGLAAALRRPSLPNRTYQYEFALPTLQSRRRSLAPGATGEITFFAAFDADHPAATGTDDLARAKAAAATHRAMASAAGDPLPGPRPRPRPRHPGRFDNPVMFPSEDLGPADLDRFFGPERRHPEVRDGVLLSFFHGAGRHVVTKAKELLMERPTGHILRSGSDLLPADDMLSVTAWMYGAFASQVAIGNTSFNKLLGVCRTPLNVLKAGGQRVFVRTERGEELLGVPSAFEMGPNSARWIYQDSRHTITVRLDVPLDAPACRTTVRVERGGALPILVSHGVVVGTDEFDAAPLTIVDRAASRVELRPAPGSAIACRYPEATFFVLSPDGDRVEAIGGDGLLYDDGVDRGGAWVVVRSKPTTELSLVLTGSVLDAGRAAELAARFGNPPGGGVTARATRLDDEARLDDDAAAFLAGLGRGATLGGAEGSVARDLLRLNDLLGWYLQNAMVHYLAPHGLEQSSGAAWGLRDACQGPVELLVAIGRPGPLREVIRLVYQHQSRGTGDWPQWFMFDRFRDVRAASSHADIIHWPIKALCDYIEATGDLSILDEQVAYTDDVTRAATAETEPLFDHVARQVARIEHDCIPGTALVAFRGGDWEDTLQPADPAMAERLVSSWTVELAYQTLRRYQAVCERAGRDVMAGRLARLCDRMRSDFNRHLVPDGVVAGLTHFGPQGPEYYLHPRDRKTGVHYRLLPMTRGIISGLLTPAQAEHHANLIQRHLAFPDGVRLMDLPMAYHGGTSRIFRRAETAASFGREVGLQYVHAHIRYVEAMARIGRPEETLRGLLTICPILIELDVPATLPRQSNAYFSSSDAAFMNRRQASRDFERIRRGQVGIKGGWRVYSSGPGIYLNQLISNVLGLRRSFDDVVFDPVLPRGADGLTFDFDFEGRPVRYRYRVHGAGYSPREVIVNGRALPGGRYQANPYRAGGLLVGLEVFRAALDDGANLVEILV